MAQLAYIINTANADNLPAIYTNKLRDDMSARLNSLLQITAHSRVAGAPSYSLPIKPHHIDCVTKLI